MAPRASCWACRWADRTCRSNTGRGRHVPAPSSEVIVRMWQARPILRANAHSVRVSRHSPREVTAGQPGRGQPRALSRRAAESMRARRALLKLPGSKRNFNFAARALGSEQEIDGTAEFMRNEIADEVAPITGLDRSRDRRAA